MPCAYIWTYWIQQIQGRRIRIYFSCNKYFLSIQKLIFFCLLIFYYFCPRGKIMKSVRALVSNQWHPRGERPTFSSPSVRSHVPMAVTSDTMIRRWRRAPHVNVTFCKSYVCVCVCGRCSAVRSERCATLASPAIPPQYSFSMRGIRRCQQPAAVCEKWRVRYAP